MAKENEQQLARVLCAFTYAGKSYEPNDIFTGTAKEIWQWERSGNLDPDVDAIAYAKANPRPKPTLGKPASF